MDQVPDSWSKQGIKFDDSDPLGILQDRNGPCGVLSVIQAVLISQNMCKPGFNSKYKVSNEDIANALSSIIEQTGKPVQFAS